MGMPEIKHGDAKRRDAITDIIESVALEQAALSHILNAEGEKIQKVVNSRPYNDDVVENPPVDTEKLLEVNKSVRDTIDAVTRLEVILQSKLNLFKDCLCDEDPKDSEQPEA